MPRTAAAGRSEDQMSKQEQWQMSAEAAELYERYPARYILGPWAPLLVAAANLASGERALDIACGTGVVARAAAKRVGATGRVVGIDLNPGMIAVARSLPQPEGPPIEWLERSALDLRLEEASFDVVLCQQGLQFFPDKLLALREMRRVLNRNGRLALSVWNSIGIYNTVVGDALARFVNKDTAARFCASRQAPTKDELQCLATEAGFSAVEIRISRMNIHLPSLDRFVLDHLTATPISPVIATADPEVRKKLGVTVMEQLKPYAEDSGVSYPEETYVLTAQVR